MARLLLFAIILQILAGCQLRPESASIMRVTDSLLVVLDNEIRLKPEHEKRKRHVIDSLNAVASTSLSDVERFDIGRKLFSEYRSYAMDTLITVARMCRQAAISIGSDTLQWRSMLMEAEAYKGIGRYDESLAVLDSLPPEAVARYRPEVLNRYTSVYYSLFENTYPRSDAEIYRGKLIACRDSLIKIYSEGSFSRNVNIAESYRVNGHPERAIEILDNISLSYDDADAGVLFYIKAESYLMMGDMSKAKYYLARSAIRDIRQCVRKYTALQELARILNEEGDVDRAYRYIMCSIEDIQRSNARSRIFGITESLPIITGAYTAASEESEMNRRMFISVVMLLLLAVVSALIVLYKRNMILKNERLMLSKKKDELTEANNSVEQLNRQLEESAKLKEKHLGNLFSLCSEYIDGMERNRVLLERKSKTGVQREAHKESYKEFLDQFDRIFLEIFPDFVDRFNSLLLPEARFACVPGEPLPPELRIYAMVKLGINDSVKIASFLHYSPQTVYNYRFKVRGLSNVPKNEFAKRVMSL